MATGATPVGGARPGHGVLIGRLTGVPGLCLVLLVGRHDAARLPEAAYGGPVLVLEIPAG